MLKIKALCKRTNENMTLKTCFNNDDENVVLGLGKINEIQVLMKEPRKTIDTHTMD